MILKIWKKGKSNSGKDLENTEERCEMIGKIWKKSKLNSEMIWKIQKKIVKRYEKYERKVG